MKKVLRNTSICVVHLGESFSGQYRDVIQQARPGPDILTSLVCCSGWPVSIPTFECGCSTISGTANQTFFPIRCPDTSLGMALAGIGRESLGHIATREEDNSKSRLLKSLIPQSLFPKEYHVTVYP